MKFGIDNVIHSVIREQNEKPNVFYMGYNGVFEEALSILDINFYVDKSNAGLRQWIAGLPNNFTVLPYGIYSIPNRIDIDAVICNSRQKQVFEAKKIADALHVPMFLIEHELPYSTAKPNLRKYVNSRMPKGIIHVIPNKVVQREWYMKDNINIIPIEYGIPVHEYRVKYKNVGIIDTNLDTSLLSKLRVMAPDTLCIGHSNQCKNLVQIMDSLQHCRISICMVEEHEPPLLPLIAMGCNTTIITNKTRWTEAIIEHGKTGYLFNGVGELKRIVRELLKDLELIHTVSARAKKYIHMNYNLHKFKTNWEVLLQRSIREPYIR